MEAEIALILHCCTYAAQLSAYAAQPTAYSVLQALLQLKFDIEIRHLKFELEIRV